MAATPPMNGETLAQAGHPPLADDPDSVAQIRPYQPSSAGQPVDHRGPLFTVSLSITGPTRVVLCDNHQLLTDGLSAMLSAERDIVVTGVARSVAEVVAMVNTHRPDVLLIAYELPDGDGAATTRVLKQAHPQLQVVMLTSYSQQDVLVHAIEAGCSGYLTKHCGAHTVATAIRQAAAGQLHFTNASLPRLLPQLGPVNRGVGARLTNRELEVLELLADGASGRAIAERLFLSSNTVRNHVQSILNKLGVHSRLEAVAIAGREGIIRRTGYRTDQGQG